MKLKFCFDQDGGFKGADVLDVDPDEGIKSTMVRAFDAIRDGKYQPYELLASLDRLITTSGCPTYGSRETTWKDIDITDDESFIVRLYGKPYSK